MNENPSAAELDASFAQERMFFLEQLVPGTSQYNVSHAFVLEGELDPDAFGRSLIILAARHESFRTTFRLVEGRCTRYVGASPRLMLERLEPVRDDDLGEALRLANARIGQPFDLERGPLVRAALVPLGQRRHLFLLVCHHLIIDGWSVSVVLEELGAIYDAERQGSPAVFPAFAPPYSRFVTWQRTWSSGRGYQTSLGYWRTKLSGTPPYQPLPTVRDADIRGPGPGCTYVRHLSGSLLGQVKAFARARRASISMALLAALKVLLFRHTGVTDVVVGVPVSGRGASPDLEGVVGLCVNTLALRTDLSKDPTFEIAFERTRTTLLEGLDHQDLPFDRLVAELNPSRSIGRNPLFDVMFAPQAQKRPSARMGPLEVRPVPVPSAYARFGLVLSATEFSDGSLECSWTYRADLFSEAAVERLARHFGRILEVATVAPGSSRRLSELDILIPDERRQILALSRGPRRTFEGPPLVTHSFEARARDAPDAVAVEAGERSLTYGMLDEKANHLAHALSSRSAFGSVGGVCLGREPEWLIAVLALMKSGFIYLPLDPGLPKTRLELMVRAAKPAFILTRADLKGLLPLDGGEALEVGPLLSEGAASSAPPARELPPDAPAYMIFTSGSSGQPKGVKLSHRGLANLAYAQAEAFQIGPQSKVLQFASPGFDASISEIFTAFVRGAALVLLSYEEVRHPERLREKLQRGRISVATLPPSLLAHLSADGLPDLQTLVTAGEPCPPRVVSRWAPGRRFLNAYGPTEATVCASISDALDPQEASPPIGRPIANTAIYVLDEDLQLLPPGVPGELFIGGQGVGLGYVNSAELTAQRFVPDPFSDDAPGRLYRTGDVGRWREDGQLEFLGRKDRQLKLRGYRIEPGEVERCLDSHPAVRQSYVTVTEEGDQKHLTAYLVSTLASSIPEFDTVDEPYAVKDIRRRADLRLPLRWACQVSDGGETYLLESIAVSVGGIGFEHAPPSLVAGASVQVTLPQAQLGEPLSLEGVIRWRAADRVGISWTGAQSPYTLRRVLERTIDAEGLSLSKLREFLRQELPDYMLPTSYVLLDALPLNANGKVAVARLPRPFKVLSQDLGKAVLPGNSLEAEILPIWRAVLGQAALGTEDDFFESGGHSLLALKLVAQMERALGRRVTVASLLQNRTIQRLAQELAREGASTFGPIVWLKGARRPEAAIVISPAGGMTFCYRDFADELPAEVALVGLHAPGTGDGMAPLRTIPELASFYLKALDQAKLASRPALLGWSFGGTVAFEMARQLRAAGREVGSLTLIDTLAGPQPVPDWPETLRLFCTECAGLGATDPELTELHPEPDWMEKILSLAREAGALPSGFDAEQVSAHLGVLHASLQAAAVYQPMSIDVPIQLVIASSSMGRYPEQFERWRGLCPSLNTLIVPGTHFSILRKPLVSAVAVQVGIMLTRRSNELAKS